MFTLARSGAAVFASFGLTLLGWAGPADGAAHAQPNPAVSADALIVSLDGVEKISGADDLHNSELSDLHRPKNLYDPSFLSPECRQAMPMESVFAAGWQQFRSVAYVGSANRGVTQAAAVYGSAADAAAALDRIATAYRRCSGTGGAYSRYTTTRDVPSRLMLSWTDAADLYETKGAVLVEVHSVHFPNAAEISAGVTDIITDRIPG